jgi:hypothetical protein
MTVVNFLGLLEKDTKQATSSDPLILVIQGGVYLRW